MSDKTIVVYTRQNGHVTIDPGTDDLDEVATSVGDVMNEPCSNLYGWTPDGEYPPTVLVKIPSSEITMVEFHGWTRPESDPT